MKYGDLSLVFLAVSASLPVYADSISDAKSEHMEHVIVTGSRAVERIDEVPASVSVIGEQEIARDMIATTELQAMLAIHVPGMAPETGKSSNSGQTLRGRKALVMIDGLPQSTPLRDGALGIRSLDPSVIERVEVIKGATSVYGNGAAGGIINYITKKADTDQALAGKIAIGSSFSTEKFEDTASTRVDLSLHGALGQFDYFTSAVIEDNGVQRDAEGDALGLLYGLSNFESKNFFTKLNYKQDDERTWQFSYNYFEGQQNSDYYPINTDLNSAEKSYAVENVDNLDIPGEPQGPRGNHNLRLQYRDTMLTEQTDFSADLYWQKLENVFFYSTKFQDPALGLNGGQSLIESEKKGLRFNFNTLFVFDGFDLNLIYGLDILNDVTSQPLIDGRFWSPEMDMDNIAAYLQSKWAFDNDWIVKAGLRRENIDVSVDDFNTLMLCQKSCTESVAVAGGTLSYGSTTYNLGIRYAGNEKFSPFASYSEGFDISDLGALLRKTNAPNISEISAKAATVKNSELGISSRWQDVDIEVAAFYSTSDLGSSIVKDPETGVYFPARAPQKIWGYETSVTYRLADNISMGASYSWLEGKDKSDDTYLDAGAINPPKLTAYVNYNATEKLFLGLSYLGVQSRKRFDSVDGNYSGRTGPVSAYNVLNASASYQWNEQLKLDAGIENLLNEDYFPHVSQAFTFNGYNVKGKGRAVRLALSYQF